MNIYLGELSAIQYIGDKEKEFNRAPFSPRPIVKKGDIIVLDKIHAYNISKLLPTEWKMLKGNIEVQSDTFLSEKIEELESYIKELEDVVAEVDLVSDSNEDSSEKQEHLDLISSSSDENLETLPTLEIGVDEALETIKELKSIEEFNEDKVALEVYALETFGIDLNKKMSFKNMYKSLENFYTEKYSR